MQLIKTVMQNKKEHYHYRNSQCEQCGTSIEKCGPLNNVEFWINDYDNSSDYLHICDNCYISRKEWDNNLFPESCDWCKKTFEGGDSNESSHLGGEYSDKRFIICDSCYSDKKNA